ncbi:hypothetical protein GS429_12400 [Natronorubrum sp. JWXQ-INN-674]|uniref:Uncharacterized protein n=1 Tax=Natronorubrum halalkaliphilum TaxID=2691917 RepID=A0A6B0VPZ2_9EURY|nr:hypothetical protein [Natronorubrum halalkaliphilum]MXV62852.1 hypothetical protein [Natronorubrum halalkaliphilum]
MNRRQYLTRAGTGVGALALLAGCLDDFTGSDSSAEVGDRTGERELDRAAGALNDAALALDVGGGAIEDPETLEFDPDEPAGLIADARAHLETAMDELDEGRRPDVETLRTYADVLEGLVAVTDTVADEGLESEAETVFATIGGDGDIATATDTVGERTSKLDEARTEYDEAADDFRTLEDRFEELAGIDRTDLESGISTLSTVLDSLETLGSGFESLLAGYDDLERGRAHAEDGADKQASEAYADAESAFETAAATLEGDEDTPAGLTDYFETAICQSDQLIDAVTAFDDGQQNEGERALAAANDCAQ